MNMPSFDRCSTYLLSQTPGGAAKKGEGPPLRAITISQETGAGAGMVGELIARDLEARQGNDPRYPWAVFDRNLVREVLLDNHLSESLEPYFPEDTVNRMRDAIEDMLGLHPSTWTLVQHTNHTIQRLAMAGNVILIGRGSHLITSGMDHVFHVRLIAPFETRVRHYALSREVSEEKAAEAVRKEDSAKARYIRSNFARRLDDPLQFHLTINTGRVGFEAAASLISEAVWSGAWKQTEKVPEMAAAWS